MNFFRQHFNIQNKSPQPAQQQPQPQTQPQPVQHVNLESISFNPAPIQEQLNAFAIQNQYPIPPPPPDDDQFQPTNAPMESDRLERRYKKSRMQWTPELKAMFERSFFGLGIHATPKRIMNEMISSGVPPEILTRKRVASYFQKYKEGMTRMMDPVIFHQFCAHVVSAAKVDSSTQTEVQPPLPPTPNIQTYNNVPSLPFNLVSTDIPTSLPIHFTPTTSNSVNLPNLSLSNLPTDMSKMPLPFDLTSLLVDSPRSECSEISDAGWSSISNTPCSSECPTPITSPRPYQNNEDYLNSIMNFIIANQQPNSDYLSTSSSSDYWMPTGGRCRSKTM